MTQGGGPGSLGHTELLAFIDEASHDAVQETITGLGLARTQVARGGILEATAHLRQHPSPQTLLIQVFSSDDAAAQLDALADCVNPATRVIVCGTIDSVRFYHWLLELGIQEYLLMPFTEQQLTQAIRKGAAAPAEGESSGPRALVAVIGASGGAGTTTVAVSLATTWARTLGRQVGLLDLDPYFGSVALSLDVEPGRGLKDALEKPDRVDALFLERVMVKPFDGLSILSAEEPLSDVIAAQVNAGEIILTAARAKFPCVLVDLPRAMDATARSVLAAADQVVLVAEPRISSLRDTLRLKDYVVDTLRRPVPKLVLNRAGAAPREELSARNFAKHYGHEASVTVPFTPEILAATNRGTPLYDVPKIAAALQPLSGFARSLLGQEAAGEDATSNQSFAGGLLARLKGAR